MNENSSGSAFGNKKLKDFNIKDIFMSLVHGWWILLLTCIIAALLAFLVTTLVIPEMYTSRAKIFLLKKDGGITTTDVNLSTTLIKDCDETIRSRKVLEPVIEKLGLNMGYAVLNNTVSVSNPSGTRYLYISVTTEDRYKSQRIADAICEEARTAIIDVIGIDNVNIVEYGTLPAAPSSPSLSKNIVLAVFITFVVIGTILILKDIWDDRIKGPADVENYLSLSVLGLIPSLEAVSDVKQGYYAHTKYTGYGNKLPVQESADKEERSAE